MIKNVIKSERGIVIVFDEDGEQLSEYQGLYEEVKDKILRDAPPGAAFFHIINTGRAVPREEW